MNIGMLRILVSPGRRDDVVEIFKSIQGQVTAQPGCRDCQIYEERGPDTAVLLVERWSSRSALEAHIRSEAYRRILEAIELSGNPPEIQFDDISSSQGMELVERLRSLGGRADPLSHAPPGERAEAREPLPDRLGRNRKSSDARSKER